MSILLALEDTGVSANRFIPSGRSDSGHSKTKLYLPVILQRSKLVSII